MQIRQGLFSIGIRLLESVFSLRKIWFLGRANKQDVVARSSAKPECRACAIALCVILFG